MAGIYLITNLVNKKVHIGQTRDLIQRALEHLHCQI
jgi:predicted GIY-YIG superfamily endonuclease